MDKEKNLNPIFDSLLKNAVVLDDDAFDKAEEQDRERERAFLVAKRLSDMPKRFADSTFESYELSEDPSVRRTQGKLIEALKRGVPVVMYGNNGTGKTRLAFASYRHQVEQGKNAFYMTASEFFDRVKAAFGDKGMTSVIRGYVGYDYLIIDEVDKSYGSPTEFIALSRLVDYRYLALKPTVLIANADNKKESDKYVINVCGRSAYERIVEDGTAFYMDWPSYRGKRFAKEAEKEGR